MADIRVNRGDCINCERAVIRARKIETKKYPVNATSKDKAMVAIAKKTVRIQIEKSYHKTGARPLDKF